MALRWGICSAGKISNDFVCALSTLDPDMHPVRAVASRSIDSAKAFADSHQIPRSYGSYEELANDPDVDIVYIGSINSTHLPLSKLFLNHNKHVLCEKPLGVTLDEVKEMIGLAREKNLFFMEAVWSRFFPSYKKIREILESGVLGEVKVVSANFGFPLIGKDRIIRKDTGGGGLLDIGIYDVQLAMLVFGDQEPESIHTVGFLADTGVDESANLTFKYKNNAMAALTYSASCTLRNEAYISGTQGSIKIHFPFWCPTKVDVMDFNTGKQETYEYPLPKSKNPFNFHNSAGLRYQAEAVRQAIQDGLTEHPFMSHNESLKLATLLQTVRYSLGYYFDDESQ